MKKLAFTEAAGVLLILVLVSGCSPTGWATREVPDGSNIERGQLVTVVEKDGSTITGRFEGRGVIDPASYDDLYNSSRQNSFRTELLPSIGETINIRTSLTESRSWEGQFVGFDAKSIWLKMPGESEPSAFYFTSLNRLSTSHGSVLERFSLRNMYLDGQIPLMSAILVKHNSKDIHIPLNVIQTISVEPEPSISQGN